MYIGTSSTSKVIHLLVSSTNHTRAVHSLHNMLFPTLLILISFSLFSSQSPITKRAFSDGPVIASNFPDPSFISVGGIYYAFATNNGAQNVQIATSPDFNNWTVTGADALPTLPSWATGNVWAPDVLQLVRLFTSLTVSGRWAQS